MGYKICRFQNTNQDGDKPDIVIMETHPEWEQILCRWKSGKDPTNSPLWKKGVVAQTRLLITENQDDGAKPIVNTDEVRRHRVFFEYPDKRIIKWDYFPSTNGTARMTDNDTKTYLGEWVRTTLWLRIPLGPKINIDVWHPPGISENERTELLQKNASQGVGIIRKLTGTKKMVIQSQYKQGSSIPRGFNKNLTARCRRIIAVGARQRR